MDQFLSMGGKKTKFLYAAVFALIMLGVLVTNFIVSEAYTEKTGYVNGTNVRSRTSPDTTANTNVLTFNGSNIYLNTGDVVTITGEETGTDNYIWYQVRFNYAGTSFNGYIRSDLVSPAYAADANFEQYLNDQGFPESYKESLRSLHTKYPNWVFVADKINYDWSAVVTAESVVGRSLIAYNSISSWKSLADGAYDWGTGTWSAFDGGAWAAASEELVAYCLDPRNFLSETSIFQYEALSYQPAYHNLSGVQNMVAGSFLDSSVEGKTYSQIFMDAAVQSGVSPYHLVARVIQEQGKNGGGNAIISGTVSGYANLFNYYNIGAYASGGRTATVNGLIYAGGTDAATLRPWNTRYASLLGGASFIGQSYICRGQDTLYYQKFDFVENPYTHQYMTHILAPSKEAVNVANAYSSEVKNSTTFTFKIPVFNNMPVSAAGCPTGTGSPNNVLNSLSVGNKTLTPTFSKFTTSYDLVVENTVSSMDINAAAVDSSARISGTGSKSLNVGANVFQINVTAGNGEVRTYTITIVRQSAPAPETTTPVAPTESSAPEGTSVTTTYNLSQDGFLSGVSLGTSTSAACSAFTLKNCTGRFLNADGTPNTGIVGTGSSYVVYDNAGGIISKYPVIIYGDVNGDGNVNSADALYLKRHILNISLLSGVYAQAGNVDKSGSGINSLDMLYLKRHILSISLIGQF
ncbi:dockerin type I domain-containing protein [Parasporobacterium paucivorans]|uniref:Beta-N-acetylglucosaminidase n=1 Tax=Parasporobacterium paucivorans DSM 15970 TaxID=1122934 RepID=A0A1M6HHN6_9FIRM|nr:dockerin type I domain-containing protein [Parasporobacterium paucivorans]SHJ21708.1 Beta-N-acetylglucosaminidase [Parasporobacterium paucivorans DSM 15970]